MHIQPLPATLPCPAHISRPLGYETQVEAMTAAYNGASKWGGWWGFGYNARTHRYFVAGGRASWLRQGSPEVSGSYWSFPAEWSGPLPWGMVMGQVYKGDCRLRDGEPLFDDEVRPR